MSLHAIEDVVADEPRIGHEHGYLVDGALYCDAGTPLWRELVAAGVLSGADADPPRPPPLGALALHVARVAERVGDRYLVAMWIHFGPRTLFPTVRRVHKGDVLATNPFTGKPVVAPEDGELRVEPTVAALAADPDAVALRDLGRRVAATSVHDDDDDRPPREHWSAAEAWFWG